MAAESFSILEDAINKLSVGGSPNHSVVVFRSIHEQYFVRHGGADLQHTDSVCYGLVRGSVATGDADDQVLG